MIGVLVAVASCTGRPRSGSYASGSEQEPSHGQGKLAEIDLTQGAPENQAEESLLPRPASKLYLGLVRAIERIREDREVTGVFVRLGTTTLGWSRAEELGRLLGSVRSKSRPVVCHADTLGNATLWITSRGCDRVWMSPGGGIDSIGIAAQMVYLKGALDKLGVVADFIHMGTYKSAAEPLTQEGPSDASREAMQSLLDSLRTSWLDGLDRARPGSDLRKLAETGPWSPSEAVERKMIDAIGFESEARKDAMKRARAGETAVAFGPKASTEQPLDVSSLIRLLSGIDESAGERPRIAVVPATGGINMEAGSLFEGSGITARALTRTLRRLKTEDSVKAVVLRIDSPGGSALASDILWHEIRELEAKKPVIASIGEMAASGGYYLACAATRIVAEATSMVGSIGVVGGKLVLGSALEKHGIHSVTFAASPDPEAKARAAYLSALTPWDEPTRERIRAQMREIYELFMRRVTAGRGLSREAVLESAEGRVWTGTQGLERKLVDELGGLGRALALARKLGGVDERAPVVLEGGVESLIETLLGSQDATVEQAVQALERHAQSKNAWLHQLPRHWAGYLESAEPLLHGERVLAALPFAISVR